MSIAMCTLRVLCLAAPLTGCISIPAPGPLYDPEVTQLDDVAVIVWDVWIDQILSIRDEHGDEIGTSPWIRDQGCEVHLLPGRYTFDVVFGERDKPMFSDWDPGHPFHKAQAKYSFTWKMNPDPRLASPPTIVPPIQFNRVHMWLGTDIDQLGPGWLPFTDAEGTQFVGIWLGEDELAPSAHAIRVSARESFTIQVEAGQLYSLGFWGKGVVDHPKAMSLVSPVHIVRADFPELEANYASYEFVELTRHLRPTEYLGTFWIGMFAHLGPQPEWRARHLHLTGEPLPDDPHGLYRDAHGNYGDGTRSWHANKQWRASGQP